MSDKAKLKILVVDDDSICLHAITSILTDCYDCKIDTAESPDEALNIVYKLSFELHPVWYDLVLMDIMMPTIKGNLLAKIISETEASMHDVPIIAITAHAEEKDLTEFQKQGITDMVFKPITKEKIEKIINSYVLVQ